LSLAWTFGVVRFLTGLGEAASYPNANRIVAFWTAKRERGIGSSLLLGGVGAGGVMAPALFAISMQRWGWQSSFLFPAFLPSSLPSCGLPFPPTAPKNIRESILTSLRFLKRISASGTALHAHL